MSKLSLQQFIQASKCKNQDLTILSLDPGETTGWSLFSKGKLVECGQLVIDQMSPSQCNDLHTIITESGADIVVYESYRVYAWKLKDHSWSEVHTAQVIGAVRYICMMAGIKIHRQTAQAAKQFCTDDKLKSWGLWQKGQRHARDAIRHACYYYIFGDFQPVKDH